MKPRIIFWIYVGTSLANLVGQLVSSEDLERYTKPLLMPLLLFYVYKSSIGNTTLKVILLSVALLFSWLGDVVLMFQANETYFILGIGLFLIAQVTYILVLRKSTYRKAELNLTKIVPFLIYGAILFYVLLPAGDFTVPIIVYGIVILVMMINASMRKGHTSERSYQLAFLGSILFVLSDSVLAVNAFKEPVPYAGFFIMSTYCAAQYLLVEGILAHENSANPRT